MSSRRAFVFPCIQLHPKHAVNGGQLLKNHGLSQGWGVLDPCLGIGLLPRVWIPTLNSSNATICKSLYFRTLFKAICFTFKDLFCTC